MNDVSAGNALFERPSRARRAWRAFIRYVVAIGVGVAATLAWQSCGETTKQIIAMRAPQLGWSPDAQRKIVAFMDDLGWAKLPAASNSAPAAQGASQAASLAQTTPEMVVQKAPGTPSLELEQIQVMAKGLITLQQTVDTLAAHQVTRSTGCKLPIRKSSTRFQRPRHRLPPRHLLGARHRHRRRRTRR
jgi:hypothetical protein